MFWAVSVSVQPRPLNKHRESNRPDVFVLPWDRVDLFRDIDSLGNTRLHQRLEIVRMPVAVPISVRS